MMWPPWENSREEKVDIERITNGEVYEIVRAATSDYTLETVGSIMWGLLHGGAAFFLALFMCIMLSFTLLGDTVTQYASMIISRAMVVSGIVAAVVFIVAAADYYEKYVVKPRKKAVTQLGHLLWQLVLRTNACYDLTVKTNGEKKKRKQGGN